MNKENVLSALNEGVCRLEFKKNDGTIRVMNATLDSAFVAYESSGQKKRNYPDNVQPVWDVDISGWRSFRWDSLIEADDVKFENQ